MKLITFSHWEEYLCVGLLFCYFFFSKSKEMQIKNRIMVNWANLVKVYLGHVLLQSGFFKILFPLAIFNFMEDLDEEQGVYSTAPSRAISFSPRFSAESLAQQHHPGCWPLSG